MEKIQSNRESKFELLRIVAMIFIIIHHYAIHGGILMAETNEINKYVAIFIYSFGQVAVNIFILISGYFLINSKFSIKKFLKTILQVLFYTLAIFILYLIFKGAPDWYTIKTCIFPIMSGTYWFITTYIMLYCLSPYINRLIENMNQKEHKNLIILLVIILCRNWLFFDKF